MAAKKNIKSNVISLAPMQDTAPVVETKSETHKELTWFYERIEKGRNGVFSEVMTITSDMAKRFLENNPSNRRVVEKYVGTVAKDIENNNWQFNGEPIIISVDGELNDGAHRLQAVVKANKPILSLVVWGVTRDSRMTVDTGRARAVKDFIYMRGVTNANNAAACARLFMAFQRMDPFFGSNFSKQEILHFYEQNEAIINHAVSYARSHKFFNSINASAVAAGYCLINRINSKDCDTFFEHFLSGANLDANNPILWLRQHVALSKDKSLTTANIVEMIIRYWNAWRREVPLLQRLPLMKKVPKISS